MTYSCLKELARVSCCSYRLNLTVSLHLDNLLIVSKAGSWLNNACFISINKDSSLSYCSEIGSSFCSPTFDLFSWEIPEDSRGKTVAWKNSMSYNKKICSDVLLPVATISQKRILFSVNSWNEGEQKWNFMNLISSRTGGWEAWTGQTERLQSFTTFYYGLTGGGVLATLRSLSCNRILARPGELYIYQRLSHRVGEEKWPSSGLMPISSSAFTAGGSKLYITALCAERRARLGNGPEQLINSCTAGLCVCACRSDHKTDSCTYEGGRGTAGFLPSWSILVTATSENWAPLHQVEKHKPCPGFFFYNEGDRKLIFCPLESCVYHHSQPQ